MDLNSPSVSRNRFMEIALWRNRFIWNRFMDLNSPSVSRIQLKFTIYFGILIRIHYQFVNILWVHYGFITFFTYSLPFSWINNELFSWIRYKLTYFRKFTTTNYLFRRKKNMNSHVVWQINCLLIIFVANSLLIYFLFRE